MADAGRSADRTQKSDQRRFVLVHSGWNGGGGGGEGWRDGGTEGGWSMPHASSGIIGEVAQETPGQPLAFGGGWGGLAVGVVAEVGFTEEP